MTPQTVFNKVVRHCLKQNKKAMKADEYGYKKCQYHAPDGTKCAVGCLISKANYRPSMEDEPIKTIIQRDLMPKHLIAHAELLDSLQNVHDCMEVEAWYYGFQNVADKFDLKMPV